MPAVDQHAPGSLCWIELSTSDPVAAKDFYGALFGYTYQDAPMGPNDVYTTFVMNGMRAAGMHKLMPEQVAMNVPPHWMVYFATENADQVVQRATELGGVALMPAFDVWDLGRMAMIQDPTGAIFGLWQPKTHSGTQIANEPGAAMWPELTTRDPEKAKAFYTALFGWGVKAGMPVYSEWTQNGESIGGLMTMTEEWPAEVPPYWSHYFLVSDCDASAAKAKELGGQLCVPPQDIPNTGRFSVISDPQGARFCIIKLGV